MRNLTTIPQQSEPKSIMDMTPFELSQIDEYQDANRSFIDNDYEDLEHFFNGEE